LPILFISTAVAQTGNLQESERKTLFVFPIEFEGESIGIPEDDTLWTSEYFHEVFVRTFERFNYIQLPEPEGKEAFLSDARTYLEEHAREIVQKQKEPDGRIREVRVTLTDLINAIENGYVFFPEINQVEGIREYSTANGFKYVVKAKLDIYNAGNGSHIETIKGDSERGSSKLGLLESLTRGLPEIKDTGDPKTRIFRTTTAGVYQQMKNTIRQTPEFQLKAVAFDTDLNAFSVNLGKNLGVRKDKRYKVWSLDHKGRPNQMLAFGKVRRVEGDHSRVQILIGSVGEGDQVLEDARFGLNIGPQLSLIPWNLKGYDSNIDVVELKDGSRVSFGHVSEYNIAWFINISELYVYTESSLYTSGDLDIVSGMVGFRKKFYVNRVGLFGTVKAGGRGTGFEGKEDVFLEGNVKKGDATGSLGYGYDIGLEYLLNPNLALKSKLSFVNFPEKTLLEVLDPSNGEWKSVTISSTGITFGIALTYTL